MATRLEELQWKLYLKKWRILFNYGVKNGLIKSYDEELIERLRHIYYGGIPASIILLHSSLSNGHCYDRGPLVTLGFGDDDFQVIDADIDSLRLRPKFLDEYRAGKTDIQFGDHCFAERVGKDGITWVYDTSLGLVFEKRLYYKLQNPKIRVKNNRQRTLDFLQEDFLSNADIERDKYSLPLTLPFIEGNLKPIQPFYKQQLEQEIKILKQEVNYDDICREIQEDMRAKGFIN